jgi:hypothetical protein
MFNIRDSKHPSSFYQISFYRFKAFTDQNNDGVVQVPEDILQENHYYAFGLGMDHAWMNNSIQPDNRLNDGTKNEPKGSFNVKNRESDNPGGSFTKFAPDVNRQKEENENSTDSRKKRCKNN